MPSSSFRPIRIENLPRIVELVRAQPGGWHIWSWMTGRPTEQVAWRTISVPARGRVVRSAPDEERRARARVRRRIPVGLGQAEVPDRRADGCGPFARPGIPRPHGRDAQDT